MKVKFNDDGEVVEVENYEQLLEYLRGNSHGLEPDIYEYMKAYARRAVLMHDHDIRAADGIDAFMEDLINLKHVEILE